MFTTASILTSISIFIFISISISIFISVYSHIDFFFFVFFFFDRGCCLWISFYLCREQKYCIKILFLSVNLGLVASFLFTYHYLFFTWYFYLNFLLILSSICFLYSPLLLCVSISSHKIFNFICFEVFSKFT